MNQRSPAEGKGKGHKLLAQVNTLGIMEISKSPCNGKSFTLPFYSFTFKKLAKNILNFQINNNKKDLWKIYLYRKSSAF